MQVRSSLREVDRDSPFHVTCLYESVAKIDPDTEGKPLNIANCPAYAFKKPVLRKKQ